MKGILSLAVLINCYICVCLTDIHAESFGFSSPSALNTNASSDGENDSGVYLASGNGKWIAVWERNFLTVGITTDISFSASVDNGVSWTPPEWLNSNAGSGNQNAEPCIATDGNGIWITVWSSRDSLGNTIGTDYDIMYSRSTDDGLNWTPLMPLNSNAATDSSTDYDDTPEIVASADGTFIIMWRAYRPYLQGTPGTDYDIYYSRSTDGGVSWSPMLPLSPDFATDEDNEHTPRYATDGEGNWISVWQQTSPGVSRNINYSQSADDGLTWSAPQTLFAGEDNSALPAIAYDGSGNWIVAWDSHDLVSQTGTDGDILYTRSSDHGATWAPVAPLNSNAATDSGNEFSPRVSVDPSGNWLAVWTSNETLDGTVGSDQDLFVSLSTDVGATWSAPAALNSNAAADTGNDFAPFILNDGSGHWLVAWTSRDSLGNTIGPDADILYATSYNLGQTLARPESWMFYDIMQAETRDPLPVELCAWD